MPPGSTTLATPERRGLAFAQEREGEGVRGRAGHLHAADEAAGDVAVPDDDFGAVVGLVDQVSPPEL